MLTALLLISLCTSLWISFGSCTASETDVVFRQGETVILNCSTAENETWMWFRGENVSGAPSGYGSTYKVNSSLLDPDTEPVYACTNSSRHVERLFHLERAFAPKPHSYDGPRPLKPGERYYVPLLIFGHPTGTYQIHCNNFVLARPTPTYTWYFFGKSIGDYPHNFQATGPTLNIRPVAIPGNYTCVAENYMGRLNVSIRLKELGSKSSGCRGGATLETYLHSKVSVPEGGDYNFTVEVGDNPSWTTVYLQRETDKKVIQCCTSPSPLIPPVRALCPVDVHSVVTGCKMKCFFSIKNVTYFDQGNYNVNATDFFKPDSKSFLLQVEPFVGGEDSSVEYISIGSTVGGGFVVISFIIFFVIKRRASQRGTKRSSKRADFWFDFFVAFSEEDFEWVERNVIKLIEEDPAYSGVTLCLHHRHFVGGKLISDNIDDLLDSCWKVIAVVSRSSIGSKWCKAEWNRAIGHSKSAVIPLVIEDVGDCVDIVRSEGCVDLWDKEESVVRETIHGVIDGALKENENVKQDVFFSYDPDSIQADDKEFIDSTFEHLSMSSLCVPPLYCNRLDQHSLARCLDLTGKTVCFVSSGYVSKVWPLLKSALLEKLRFCWGEYSLILVVEPGVEIDTEPLECVKISVNPDIDNWKEELEDNLRMNFVIVGAFDSIN